MHIINMFKALMRPLNPSLIKASRTSSLKTHFKYARCLAFISVFSLLTACGSGDDDGDTQAPVITLNGENTISIPLGRAYSETGATASDDLDGIVDVTIEGDVNTDSLGVYTLTYTTIDAAGNQSTVTRTVTVREFRPFITTWKTDNYGTSDDNQITITTTTDDQDYTIDWGDGSESTGVTGGITHTYSAAGIYTVNISGDFKNIRFDYGTDNKKLLSIEQWGDIQWSTMEQAFTYCENLIINAPDIPDLIKVTKMSEMFYGIKAINSDISQWDVSSVEDMSGTFFNVLEADLEISQWDVSSVSSMSAMFSCNFEDYYCPFNSDISQWDVSSVKDMSYMFHCGEDSTCAFNQDISQWDVSSVTDMSKMFGSDDGSSHFNQDISQWNVSSVTDMSNMFEYTNAFNQDISQWDVSSVTDMSMMFYEAQSFNQEIGQWDVSSVTDMSSMFDRATAFNQDISQWDVSHVESMSFMFYQATLSTANYDALLQGWSSQILQSNVSFHGGNSQYSSASESARNALLNTYSWSITDGGLVSPQ